MAIIRKILVAAASASALVLASCGSTGSLPKWVDDPDGEYPTATHISAVGSGNSRQSAESAAKFAVCQVLGERISGEQNLRQSDSTGGSATAALDLSVTEKVLFEKIVGVKIVDSCRDTDNGRDVYYSLAVLNKNEAWGYYSQKISSLESEIVAAMKQAESERGSLRAVAQMNRALALAEENEYNIEILSSIMATRQSVKYGGVQNVRNLRSSIGDEVRVFVNVSGDDSGRILSAFQSALSDAGVTLARTGEFGYLLYAEVQYENLPDSNGYRWIRCNLNTTLSTNDERTVILPYNWNSREGHLDAQQAKNRAIMKIVDKVAEEYAAQLKAAMEQY